MYIISIPFDSVIDAVIAYASNFTETGETVARGQVNRVAMPPSPCIIITELMQHDLQVPYSIWRGADNQIDVHIAAKVGLQIDCYGPSAAERCQVIGSMWRTGWGFDAFPENTRPLYCSDGNQSPLVTGEQQYESRWTLTAFLQYNPIISVPQQFADELAVTLILPTETF